MTSRRWAVLAAAVITAHASFAAGLAPCPERPKDTKKAKKLATKWWGVGVKLYDLGSFREAIAAWKCANRLAPHPLAVFNIGRASERAGMHTAALGHYETYLRQNPRAPNRKWVEAAIRRLREKLKHRPAVSPRPRPSDTRPRDTRPLDTRPRDTRPPHVRPPPVRPPADARPGPAVSETPSAPPAKKRKVSMMKILGWTSVGFAGAMTVLSGVFGGLAINAKNKVEKADPGADWKSDLRSYYRNYPKYKAATWACVGLAGAGLVAGTVLLILDKRRSGKGKESEREKVSVVPFMIGPGSGLGFSGRF